jgi:G:T-mismatch repair DNA endonuclease (very short patch repair protein)
MSDDVRAAEREADRIREGVPSWIRIGYEYQLRVVINAPGTAWHGHRATIRSVAKRRPTSYWLNLEGRDLTAQYKASQLLPVSAVDRLGALSDD